MARDLDQGKKYNSGKEAEYLAAQRQQEPFRADADPVMAAQGQRKPREADAGPSKAA